MGIGQAHAKRGEIGDKAALPGKLQFRLRLTEHVHGALQPFRGAPGLFGSVGPSGNAVDALVEVLREAVKGGIRFNLVFNEPLYGHCPTNEGKELGGALGYILKAFRPVLAALLEFGAGLVRFAPGILEALVDLGLLGFKLRRVKAKFYK